MKLSILAQSLGDAKYDALPAAIREVIWLQKFRPSKISSHTFDITTGENNQSCISTSDDPIISERSKIIDVNYQLIIENVRKGVIRMFYAPLCNRIAEVMTSALARPYFQKLRRDIGT